MEEIIPNKNHHFILNVYVLLFCVFRTVVSGFFYTSLFVIVPLNLTYYIVCYMCSWNISSIYIAIA